MDNEHLLQRDIEILQRARSIGKNMSALMMFGVALMVAVLGLISVGISGMWGWVTFGAIIVYVVADSFLKLGEKAAMVGIALISGVLGLLTLAVVAYVFTQPAAG